MFSLEEFVASPTIEAICTFTRDQLVMIAGHYKIEVTGSPAKADLLDILIDTLSCERPIDGSKPGSRTPERPAAPSVVVAELELRRLQVREKEMEWELVRERERREHEYRMKDLDLQQQALRLKELEIKARESNLVPADHFDVIRNLRLVPPFNESEVEFFAHFERVATVMKWPRNAWTITLQSIFMGKAQQAYSSLSLEDAAEYDKVKEAVLRIYSLVPEAYRHKYRNYRKPEGLTYVEFVREKEMLFDRWVGSQNITSFEGLRDLIIMEDFKNCLPKHVSAYLGEQKDLKPADASVRADEYVLAHRGTSPCPAKPPSVAFQKAFRPAQETVADHPRSDEKRVTRFKDQRFCGRCKRREHEIHVPIKVLRDTAASQSFVLEGVLPFDNGSYTGENVLVQGLEMGFANVPLHEVSLISNLVAGVFKMGVRSSLPVKDVHMLLGNDIMGGIVFLRPVVVNSPEPVCPDDVSVNFPEVFHANVVARAMAQKGSETAVQECDDELIHLYDTFIARPLPVSGEEKSNKSAPLSVLPCIPKMPLGREQLLLEQKNDSSLSSLFADAVSEKDIESVPQGYFFRDGVLMRKWRPLTASVKDEWRVLKQVVVPSPWRNDILCMAHDNHFSGHLGINKTSDRILRQFFWPGLKADVAKYCKSCHICQVTGKPNQLIPPAPLQPIPVMTEPFEHVILDCVGPLPRTKSGKEYLLTAMCTLTRFPEAIPLRTITASAVIKVLVAFFSTFGLPKIVQTDQGNNFTSKVFKQAMRQLGIKHITSSCYHPQTQGALERFHLTLKSMLRAFCLEFRRDWDEGIPFALFAAREVVQESLGFSPSELVFGVRCSLRKKAADNRNALTHFICLALVIST
ncbi:Retrovirus-related Pol polyprotein from transposon 412 [Merluccius polli]|uniref:Gypsy retrotransposon integrase-like protein 1 n=1 Tax=Merluccius polli TaxID=89951 RepID=A0AA47P4G8_MERPO|nr:Retrovirus-related Pol polyprotein from transposon 412 [Merluccius polli]